MSGYLSWSAVYTGIEFSEEEKALHASRIETITKTSADCLERKFENHINFFNTFGVSLYYGNRRYTKGWGRRFANGRWLTPIKPELQKRRLDLELEDSMLSISCVDLALTCLREGFQEAELMHQWNKVRSFVPNKIGNRLQHALQALGWKILYWNPDPSKNVEWDEDDRRVAPGNPLNVWGNHEAHYNNVMRRNRYLYNHVDDKESLVGFRTDAPEFMKDIPFAIGTAHAGYHVFPVSYGDAIEAHSTRSLFSIDNLEYSPFNPLEVGGGPRWTRTEKYRSGIIVIPPEKTR
jgi:hypothetical protein